MCIAAADVHYVGELKPRRATGYGKLRQKYNDCNFMPIYYDDMSDLNALHGREIRHSGPTVAFRPYSGEMLLQDHIACIATGERPRFKCLKMGFHQESTNLS